MCTLLLALACCDHVADSLCSGSYDFLNYLRCLSTHWSTSHHFVLLEVWLTYAIYGPKLLRFLLINPSSNQPTNQTSNYQIWFPNFRFITDVSSIQSTNQPILNLIPKPIKNSENLSIINQPTSQPVSTKFDYQAPRLFLINPSSIQSINQSILDMIPKPVKISDNPNQSINQPVTLTTVYCTKSVFLRRPDTPESSCRKGFPPDTAYSTACSRHTRTRNRTGWRTQPDWGPETTDWGSPHTCRRRGLLERQKYTADSCYCDIARMGDENQDFEIIVVPSMYK